MSNIPHSREFTAGAPELSIPTLAEVMDLYEQGYSVIPLVETLPQRETAGAVYERLRRPGEPSFLLESAEPNERQGRYSYIGVDPEATIRLQDGQLLVNGTAQGFSDPHAFVSGYVQRGSVAPVADAPPMFGGAAGLFGYDLARYQEPVIGMPPRDDLELPEMALMVPGTTVAFDHYKQTMSLVNNLAIEPGDDYSAISAKYDAAAEAIQNVKSRIEASAEAPASAEYEPLAFASNMSPDQFKNMVKDAKEHIAAGDIFQIVLSQRFSSDGTVDADFAHQAYERLKRLNPSKHAFLFEFPDFQVAGCSPETLVSTQNGALEHMAIAGTRKRGADSQEDQVLAAELQADEKELAEHDMLVDLSRNDVGKVCVAGSVEVARYAEIENHSHVMHMGSEITGTLRPDQTALDALKSISPAGTLSGAPKIRAMQLINEMEPTKRGFYGGAVGYLSTAGDLVSSIFIRSLTVDREGRVHVQAGAGVVADSDPEAEFRETQMKAAAPLKAVQQVTEGKAGQKAAELREPARRSHRAIRSLGRNVLVVDNYDSYTFNLVQYLAAEGADVSVVRNDIAERELFGQRPDLVVVSPGPGHPSEAGLSMAAMRRFPEMGIPTLGVCLGHQALVAAFGGSVVRHKPVQGKTSRIEHDGQGVFRGVPNGTEVMRYHSLVADPGLPDELKLSASMQEDGKEIVMAVRHRVLPVEGVQFHPEAYKTADGPAMLKNFLAAEA